MRWLHAVAIALFLPAIFAQAIEVPQLASSASIVINESGTVLVQGGGMKDLWLRIPLPIDSEYQKVSTDSPYKLDQNGNPYIEITVKSPVNPFQYSKSSTVQIVQRITGSLPATSRMGEGELKYLAATNRTQSDNPVMVALAANITAGSEDDFEKVARLAIWVNNYVVYNQNYIGQKESALAVLAHGQGVCFEYATLFAALARAEGIPTRYVTGNAYSSLFNTWLGHAWDEVYLGKWVPVDPTWFEVGTLDALHVESAKYVDVWDEDDLKADIYPPSARLEWETNGRSGAVAANIATLQVGIAAPESGFTLAAAESRIAPGDSTIVYLEIEGKDYRVVPVSLASCTGFGAFQVDGDTQYLILRPGRKSAAAWKVNAPADVPKSYYYTCPLTLNSPYLEERTVEVNVDPRLKALPAYKAALQEENATVGSQDAVLLGLPSARQGKEYYAITEWGVSAANVSSGQAVLPFEVRAAGNRTIYVAGQGGGYYELAYQALPKAASSVFIDGISLPPVLIEGRAAHAAVNVSAQSYPERVNVELEAGGQREVQSSLLGNPASFQFDFTPEKQGPLEVRVNATPFTGSGEQRSAFANVEAQPQVRLSSADFAKKGSLYETTLRLEQSGSPQGISVSVDGQRQAADGGSAVFSLSEGSHSLMISWLDAAGNGYETNEPLQVKPAGIFGSQASGSAGQGAPGGMCPAALLAISVFACASLLKR